MYHNFLIHSSADGHLGCYHVLAIVNSASVNIRLHVSLSVLVSLGCMSSSGISRSYGSSVPVLFCFLIFFLIEGQLCYNSQFLKESPHCSP